jgi:endonuclease/exonuclease/phosphatase family protein
LSGHPVPATTVLYDFIQILIDDLAADGLDYTVVGTVNGLDVQGPDASGNDLRLTDRVALLARADEPPGQLRWGNVQSADYPTYPVIHVGGSSSLTVPLLNGWVSADFTKRGETFRVITTHLDSFVPAINGAQAQELINGPAKTSLPVIVMGDLNSRADDSTGPAHQDFLGAGFQDTWTETHPGDPGLTAMPSVPYVNLTRPDFAATQRIDYVFTRGGFSADAMSVEGTAPTDRTPDGLWPSDHAALVATLDLPGHQIAGDDGAAVGGQAPFSAPEDRSRMPKKVPDPLPPATGAGSSGPPPIRQMDALGESFGMRDQFSLNLANMNPSGDLKVADSPVGVPSPRSDFDFDLCFADLVSEPVW